MIIIYQNEKEMTVSLQETLSLDTYFKLFFENDVLIKKEEYKNHSLEYIYHYKKRDELTEDIQLLYRNLNTRFSIIERSVINTQTLELWQDFDEADLIFKYKILYNAGNNCICKEYLDIETDKPIYEETEKYYYTESSSELDYIIKASYNTDATLNYLVYFKSGENQPADIEYKDANELAELSSELKIDSSELKYYFDAYL